MANKILAFVLHQIRFVEDEVEKVINPGRVYAFEKDVHAEFAAQNAVREPTETEAALHKLEVKAKSSTSAAPETVQSTAEQVQEPKVPVTPAKPPEVTKSSEPADTTKTDAAPKAKAAPKASAGDTKDDETL